MGPNLSAWAYLFGNHNFSKLPLAPPGTKVIIHIKPGNRQNLGISWRKWFYVGPATNAIYMQCMKQRHMVCSITFVRWMEDPYIVPSLTVYVTTSFDVEYVLYTTDG